MEEVMAARKGAALGSRMGAAKVREWVEGTVAGKAPGWA